MGLYHKVMLSCTCRQHMHTYIKHLLTCGLLTSWKQIKLRDRLADMEAANKDLTVQRGESIHQANEEGATAKDMEVR